MNFSFSSLKTEWSNILRTMANVKTSSILIRVWATTHFSFSRVMLLHCVRWVTSNLSIDIDPCNIKLPISNRRRCLNQQRLWRLKRDRRTLLQQRDWVRIVRYVLIMRVIRYWFLVGTSVYALPAPKNYMNNEENNVSCESTPPLRAKLISDMTFHSRFLGPICRSPITQINRIYLAWIGPFGHIFLYINSWDA